MAAGTILVTGTSTGIGRACAAELAGRGYRVLAGVRRDADADAVRALAPDRIEPLILDVTDREAIAALPERVGGELAGLVNNAGVSIPGPLEYLPIDDVRRQIEVMLLAPFALTQALLPALRRSGGRVVMIGSIGGRVAQPFISPYNAAKYGIAGLSDSLRRELAPRRPARGDQGRRRQVQRPRRAAGEGRRGRGTRADRPAPEDPLRRRTRRAGPGAAARGAAGPGVRARHRAAVGDPLNGRLRARTDHSATAITARPATASISTDTRPRVVSSPGGPAVKCPRLTSPVYE
jgi:NAD(P)-dependent dehydrogenase (short-subunit alcohol dehydrogenase family)